MAACPSVHEAFPPVKGDRLRRSRKTKKTHRDRTVGFRLDKVIADVALSHHKVQFPSVPFHKEDVLVALDCLDRLFRSAGHM